MKKVIFMLAAAALVVSCTKTEMTDINADGVLIQAKPVHQLVDGSVSRAPYTGNIAIDNKLEAQVLTYKPAGALHADGLMNFASTSDPVAYATGTPGAKFDASTPGDYTMYGLYPKGWTATATAPTFTFTGCEDVMATAKAITSEAGVVAGSIPPLTFKHQLTKFIVKVKADNPEAVAVWKELSEIKLTQIEGSAAKVCDIATYNLATGSVAFTQKTANAPMNFYVINSSQVFTETAFATEAAAIEVPNAEASNILPIAYSMVAPFTPANNKDITLSVKASYDAGSGFAPVTKLVNLSVPILAAPAVTTAGYAYTITLSFTDEEKIFATANVVDWIDGEDIGGIIQ